MARWKLMTSMGVKGIDISTQSCTSNEFMKHLVVEYRKNQISFRVYIYVQVLVLNMPWRTDQKIQQQSPRKENDIVDDIIFNFC